MGWHPHPLPRPGRSAARRAARSADAAALLVGHLPPADKARLCMLARCLGRELSALLPTPVVWRLLALSLVP